MNVNVSISNRIAKVEVEGRLDVNSAPLFHKEMASIDLSLIDSVEMDFSGVGYVSSVGLREFIILKKKLGEKKLRLEKVNPLIDEIFRTTGFDTILDYSVFDPKTDYSNMSFKGFLEHKAKNGPDKEILSSDGASYNWKDIEKCSRIIANDLAKLGVGKGTHVAICGANSINWVLTFYAIQMLGAIAILANSSLSAPEIVKLSEIGDITVFCYGEILTMQDEKEFLSEITGEGSLITTVYDIRTNISFKDRLPEYEDIRNKFEGRVGTDDAALMIFTSGSTGVPKGVLLSAYNVLNAACSNAESIRLTKDDRACLILPLFHVFGMVAGLFANAVSDATMVIPGKVKTAEIIRTIAENQCTVFHAVPTMLLSIINNPEFSPEKLASLRSTILSGAPVSEAQMRMLQELFPGNHFAASYGLSEMAPVSITDYEDSVRHITKTIGKPVPSVDIRIFDNSEGKVCKPGTTGEIQVRGYNLMTCYYKADMDMQSIDGDGRLHTGDLGYLVDDGYLYFVGRSKELIIRGGENIVPNEIASAISQNEDIADVKVVGVPDDFWGETVAAAVLMKEGKTFEEETMRSELKSRLAKFKMPAHFIVYDKFPMLANGKVDSVTLRNDVVCKCKKAS